MTHANAYKLGLAAAGMLAAMVLTAQTTSSGPILSLTATTQNVSGANDSIRIDVLRWSTDAERTELLSAWNMTLPPPPAPAGRGRGGAGAGAAAGAGGRGAGRGAAAAPADAGDGAAAAAAAGDDSAAVATPPAAAGGRGGRGGGGGRGGRGGGAPAADAPKPTPEGTLATELDKVPTVGYVWSSEVTGYAVHYAVKLPAENGGQRILLITDRRLGTWNDRWKLTAPGAATGEAGKYDFSVIELHLNAKDEGEGKASLSGKLAVDTPSKLIALDDYASLPVIFKAVRRK
jgi:hypothetical protein